MILRKKYPSLSFAENFLGGHLTIGRVTVYGENAMHWAVNIKFKNNFLCFRLPFRCFKKWWPMYCYLSPNATPNRAVRCLWGRKKHGGFDFLDWKEGKWKFKFGWCDLCETACIICPECGNNTCNGGYGTDADGETCCVCHIAYQYDEWAKRFDKMPKSKEEVSE